jgi:drug/metabolite transporter (DMT)-like permease
VAAAALGLRREVPARGLAAASGIGLGTLFGAAGIFYFLGLRDLPVAVAAPAANSYVVLTVVLSSLFLGQSLDWRRMAGIAVTLVGVAILAGSSG